MHKSSLCKCLFRSDVLADICLVEADDAHGIGVSTFGRRLCRNAETERKVGHGIDDDARVLFRVFGDPAKTSFGHVVSVQKLLLS